MFDKMFLEYVNHESRSKTSNTPNLPVNTAWSMMCGVRAAMSSLGLVLSGKFNVVSSAYT